MHLSLKDLAEAAELTRAGRLNEATHAIQRALRELKSPDVQPRPQPNTHTPSPYITASHTTPSTPPQADVSPDPGNFERHEFTSAGKPHAYWLYTRAVAADASPLPVVVMLHGCTQDGQDFARGTGMNTLAQHHGCLVVYPEQRHDSNRMRCWNWFEPAHQQRGAGEPEMIAALARHVAAAHHGDASRIYVAGLSAGGAMAAVVAQLYPDVFAAVGVHSGLPSHSANDVVSAMAEMRKPGRAAKVAPVASLPTIVFHGNADRTVHPGNGKAVVLAAVQAAASAGQVLRAESAAPGQSQRTAKRTVHLTQEGLPWVESWEIAGAPHAWSGGSAQGSYTDPQGPDASAAMLAFFLRHRRELGRA